MSKLFVLAGIKYFQIIDGSFFVPYASCLKNLSKVVLLVCNGMLSRIYRRYSFIIALPRCFPKASAKVMQVFELANKLKSFFVKKARKN